MVALERTFKTDEFQHFLRDRSNVHTTRTNTITATLRSASGPGNLFGPNALEAHRRFERNAAALQEWQIIFAEESDAGSIKLLDLELGSSGIATSVFRGKSLWLMDAPFVSQSGPVGFQGGSAMFLDSNAATYIRQIAYQDGLSPEALNRANLINQLGPRLQQLNPYLYLWESLQSWNDETVARCKESVAAIHALSSSGGKLSAEWGDASAQTSVKVLKTWPPA